jgi:hypothetical protein
LTQVVLKKKRQIALSVERQKEVEEEKQNKERQKSPSTGLALGVERASQTDDLRLAFKSKPTIMEPRDEQLETLDVGPELMRLLQEERGLAEQLEGKTELEYLHGLSKRALKSTKKNLLLGPTAPRIKWNENGEPSIQQTDSRDIVEEGIPEED